MTRRRRPASAGPRHAIRPVPRRTPRDDLEGVARILATAYLEIRDGNRSVTCLRRHVTPAVADHLGAVARGRRRRGSQPPRVVRTTWTARNGCVDVCVLVRQGRRVGAVALRMEIHDGRWLVTELSAPEDRTRVVSDRGTS